MHTTRPHAVPPSARLLALAALATLGGCATGPDRNPADPFEPLNRATYRFNDAIDRTVAQPVARGYNKVVPSPIRTGIANFFSNLGDVPVMLNDFAQLRIKDGLSDLARLTVNTTAGLLGFFDLATPSGLPKHDQDFGLTLGHYGVPSGPYLVLPLFGPSSVRDAAGVGVDQYASVTNQLDPAWRNSLWGVNFVSARARYLDATNLLEQAALDKYLFVRDAWLAQRQSKLDEGKQQALPDYDADQGGGAGAGTNAGTSAGTSAGDAKAGAGGAAGAGTGRNDGAPADGGSDGDTAAGKQPADGAPAKGADGGTGGGAGGGTGGSTSSSTGGGTRGRTGVGTGGGTSSGAGGGTSGSTSSGAGGGTGGAADDGSNRGASAKQPGGSAASGATDGATNGTTDGATNGPSTMPPAADNAGSGAANGGSNAAPSGTQGSNGAPVSDQRPGPSD